MTNFKVGIMSDDNGNGKVATAKLEMSLEATRSWMQGLDDKLSKTQSGMIDLCSDVKLVLDRLDTLGSNVKKNIEDVEELEKTVLAIETNLRITGIYPNAHKWVEASHDMVLIKEQVERWKKLTYLLTASTIGMVLKVLFEVMSGS